MGRDSRSPSQGKKKMAVNSLLVVEDEVLVARDIKARLTRMGYEVVDTVTKGRDAIERTLTLRPDLVLMDIHLADDIDGIEAALKIREKFDVPIIFCTAYSNDETLQRAKVSSPYGYVLKPFDNRELEINIEIALYKHQAEKDLAHTRRRLDATLTSISDGVVVTNLLGEICLINSMAEKITGFCRHQTEGLKLPKMMRLTPIVKGGAEFNVSSFNLNSKVSNVRQQLRNSVGELVPVELSVNVIEADEDELVVITFRDITKQVQYEERIRHSTFYDLSLIHI